MHRVDGLRGGIMTPSPRGQPAVADRERRVHRQLFRHDRGRNFVEPQSAESFRHARGEQAEVRRLFQEAGHQPFFVKFQFRGERQNFLRNKFLSRLPDQLMVVRQIRRREIRALGPVGIQDSHPGLVVIQAADGPIRFN